MEIKRTSLYEKHIALKAKMGPFAGFDMPLQYSSVKDEALAVRNGAGVFDVSHMGEFFVLGKDGYKFVDHLITNDFLNSEENKAVYSPLCREDGTVIDDLIAYKLGPERVLICVNASNIEKDFSWMQKQLGNFSVDFTNQSDKYSLLALQGPKSEEILLDLGILKNKNLPYYGVAESTFKNEDLIIARTGYTGEDGFEIFCSHQMANLLWDLFLKKGVMPCGLAARDVLRLEVGYPLYGHELNDTITPLDCALKWTVKLEKDQFIGKSALSKYSPKFQLVKLSLDVGIPRENYPVLDSHEKEIGRVTSGTMSVVTGKGIAMALIEKEKMPANKEFLVNIRNKFYKAKFHLKSFVNGGHK
jgi:aminomethyltransferase